MIPIIKISKQAKEDMVICGLTTQVLKNLFRMLKKEETFVLQNNDYVFCFRKGSDFNDRTLYTLRGVCSVCDYEAIKDDSRVVEIWLWEEV